MNRYLIIIEKIVDDFDSDRGYPVTEFALVVKANNETLALDKAKEIMAKKVTKRKLAMVFDNYFYYKSIYQLKEDELIEVNYI